VGEIARVFSASRRLVDIGRLNNVGFYARLVQKLDASSRARRQNQLCGSSHRDADNLI
jgi:hypothetical protein